MSADFFFCDIINNPFHYIGELVNKKKKIDEIDDKYFSFLQILITHMVQVLFPDKILFRMN